MAKITAQRVPGMALLVLLWMVTALAPVYAQTDAYSVEVAVFDRSADEQQDAYVAAFRRVLINNSGDKTLLNRDQVRSGLQQAENFVVSFTYRTPPPGTVISSEMPITDQVRQTGQATQLMLVSFDRSLVRELIDTSAPGRANKDQEEEQPVALRTDSALVWLLIQDDGRDIMISDPAAANVRSRSREIAGASGVSLVFPAANNAVDSGISVDELLAQDYARILEASERYEQDTVLVGSLARNGVRGWIGQWTRLVGQEQQVSSFETGSLDEALRSGLSVLNGSGAIDETYRYGGESSDTEALIWVGSLNSLSDYATTVNFLQGLNGVATVYPKEVSDSSMVFAVLPRSALTDVENALVSQNWLRQTLPPVTTESGSLSRNADMTLEFSR